MTGVTSSWASCGVRASKGTRGSDDDAVPEICSDSTSLYPVRGILCQHEKMNQLEKFGPSQDGIVSTTLRPLRAVHPSSRTKFPGPSSPGQAGEDIPLFCLIGDDVHQYRINYFEGPISSRARQLSRDIAEVPRVSDRSVVNVASSVMTAPLIKSRPCSGKRAYQEV